MKQTFEPQQQTHADPPYLLFLLLAVLALLLAWPAILLGLGVGFSGKRWHIPALAWFGLACLGLFDFWLLCLYTGYIPLLQALIHAIPPAARWNQFSVWQAFIPHFVPLWIRSLLLTPLCTFVVHIFPKGLEEQLLSHERDRINRQDQASQRAKRALRTVPDQIKGQAVLGAVIETTR